MEMSMMISMISLSLGTMISILMIKASAMTYINSSSGGDDGDLGGNVNPDCCDNDSINYNYDIKSSWDIMIEIPMLLGMII